MKRTVLLSLIMTFFVFAGQGWASPVFLARGAMSKASFQLVAVAASESDLNQIRSQLLPDLREDIKVDFDHNVAVFAFGGRFPSAGYRVEIDQLAYCGQKIDISMRTVKAEGSFFAQVITSPWVVVTIAK